MGATTVTAGTCRKCGRFHNLTLAGGCLPREPAAIGAPSEFVHGAMWGVEMPDVATDPRDCEVLDNVTACVDADGWLIVMCAGETVGVSPAATLRLRDKLNACFPP